MEQLDQEPQVLVEIYQEAHNRHAFFLIPSLFIFCKVILILVQFLRIYTNKRLCYNFWGVTNSFYI
jgi:hypothetical protein